jgi:drug/metabolite transporter (DMT)-like permease
MPHDAALPVRRPLDTAAVGLMVLLTMSWGLQQVAIKLAAHGVSPVMQAGIRSIVASLLLLAWARSRRIALFDRDGTFAAGLMCGVLFATEFAFIYFGLGHTTASRMIVFVYLAPVLTALGLVWLVPGERLAGLQWAGVLLAFIGLAAAFADGFFASTANPTWLGDLCGVIAAALWAATTVLIRRTTLTRAPATKTLWYQLAVSAVLLPPLSMALGEPGIVVLDDITVASLVFQSVVVAFASYLVWFWLLTRYLAARLSVFSFLSPLFGVTFGVLILGDRLTPSFVIAALLVGVGIALVNVRRT